MFYKLIYKSKIIQYFPPTVHVFLHSKSINDMSIRSGLEYGLSLQIISFLLAAMQMRKLLCML